MKKPSGRPPRRSQAQKQVQRRIVRVLTEGAVTEPSYLYEWVRRNRRHVCIKLDDNDKGMTPDQLVRHAKDHLHRQPRKRADRDFDEIWCVFDTDDHEKLREAVNEAKQSDINVAVSNPCFELWLVLHTREQTAFIHRRDVQRLSEQLGLSDGKKIPTAAWDTLVPAFETAKDRARALAKRHRDGGSSPTENPSSDVWRLVDRLRGGPAD